MNKARDCLTEEYVDLHLGMNHITRNDIKERNLTIPRAIYGDDENSKAIVICDGTYIYIHKSANFLFQRQSYSLHKFQNLLKPFLIVCTDGYIIDVKGPYAATKTDANIMSSIMNNNLNPIHILLDGKTCNVLTDTSSSQACNVCKATPKELNNLDLLLQKQYPTSSFKFGISVLHSYLRCYEYLLHISY